MAAQRFLACLVGVRLGVVFFSIVSSCSGILPFWLIKYTGISRTSVEAASGDIDHGTDLAGMGNLVRGIIPALDCMKDSAWSVVIGSAYECRYPKSCFTTWRRPP